MAINTVLLVVACLAVAATSVSGDEYPKQFPITLGLNRYEVPFRINEAFDNKWGSWNWNVFVVCGNGPWLEKKFEDAVADSLKSKNDIKTWEEFLDTDDATEEDKMLQLPTCLYGDELNAMGIDVTVRAFMVYGVDHQMLKVAKELVKSDIRQQMTPAREIYVRKQIRYKMYDNDLKFMANGHGITKEGPSFAPRLLRYLFHDALDYNNIVLFNGTHTKFPEDFKDDGSLSDRLITSRNTETGNSFLNMLKKPKNRLKIGGVDGCSLDPMEATLSEEMALQVRKDSALKFLKPKSPRPNSDQNIGLAEIHKQAYNGVLSTIFDGHRLMSEPDMMVLATASGLEQFFMSPSLPVNYGRRDRWGLKNCDFKDGFKASLQTSIVNSWDPKDTQYNFKVLKHLGFKNKKLVAALMGAHSIGQVQPCNTGDSGFGMAFCEAEALYLQSIGIKVGKFKPNFEDPSVPSPGSFFDTTPEMFDNDYYKMLKLANSKRVKNDANANPSGYLQCGSKTSLQCQLETCARTFDSEDEKFVVLPNVTGHLYGFTKRVALTASEVVMMDNKMYKKSVKALAKSNSDFKESFVDAWKVLVDIGHWEEELYTALPDPCTITSSGDSATATCGTPTYITNTDDISMVTIDLSTCILTTEDMMAEASATIEEIVEAGPCQLTGAYGTNLAILQCLGFPSQNLFCAV